MYLEKLSYNLKNSRLEPKELMDYTFLDILKSRISI